MGFSVLFSSIGATYNAPTRVFAWRFLFCPQYECRRAGLRTEANLFQRLPIGFPSWNAVFTYSFIGAAYNVPTRACGGLCIVCDGKVAMRGSVRSGHPPLDAQSALW
eukprot:5046333-Pyramimonas_sp.AAC.2